MGTGCGGGIVHQGEIITGPQAIAGEWGHMSIHPDGPLCYCGQRGCVETFISGGGLEMRYSEQFGAKRSRSSRKSCRTITLSDPKVLEFMKIFFSAISGQFRGQPH